MIVCCNRDAPADKNLAAINCIWNSDCLILPWHADKVAATAACTCNGGMKSKCSIRLEGKGNECGGIYSVSAPKLNMCFPPLAWQTYDVDFNAAKYADGKRVQNPSVTARHNGVVTHDDLELPGERNTTAAPNNAGPEPGPVYLQDHGNPVRYRNIWMVEKD